MSTVKYAQGKLPPLTKIHTTVRIDSDVMLWLKSPGKGYQARLNSILRQAMLDALKKAHD